MKNKGFGAYFFPFVTIHNSNVKLKKAPEMIDRHYVREISVKHSLPDFDVVVTDDGFVGVMTKKRETALEYLQILFATTEINSPAFTQISDSDIVEFEIDKKSENIIFKKFQLARRNYISIDRDTGYNFETFPRVLLTPLDLRNFLDNALIKMKSPEKTDYLLLGEAWTLLSSDMLKASFLLSWMVIESYIIQKWGDYVNSISKPDVEKEKLLAFTKWEVSRYSKFLHEINKINDEDKESLDELRGIRNDVIHKKISTTQMQAWECFSLAYKLVNKKKTKIEINALKEIEEKEKKSKTNKK